MTGFEAGDIVVVPFPHVEREVRRRRPALVVSAAPIGRSSDLLWVLMITNASRQRWPGDIDLSDHAAAGLPIPSMVRCAKIATIESGGAEPIGGVAAADWAKVRQFVAGALGLSD